MSTETLFKSVIKVGVSSLNKGEQDIVLDKIKHFLVGIRKNQEIKEIPKEKYVWIDIAEDTNITELSCD